MFQEWPSIERNGVRQLSVHDMEATRSKYEIKEC